MDRLPWMLAEIPLTSGKGMLHPPCLSQRHLAWSLNTPWVKISNTLHLFIYLFFCLCIWLHFCFVTWENSDRVSLCKQKVCRYLHKTNCLCVKTQRAPGWWLLIFLVVLLFQHEVKQIQAKRGLNLELCYSSIDTPINSICTDTGFSWLSFSWH